MATQKEEFRIIEETLARCYNVLKEAMQKQSDTMTTMMSQMMEMMKNQPKP